MAEDSLDDELVDKPKASSKNNENLEEIVKKHKPRGFFGKLFDYTIAAASVFASYLAVGSVALIANAIAFVSDRIVNWKRGRDTPSRQTRDSALLASLIAIPGAIGFDLMNKYINTKTWSGWLLRGAVQLGVYQPAIGLTYTTLSYPLINKTFNGLYEKGYKQLWWGNYKDSIMYLGVLDMLSARYVPAQMQYPVNLGLRTVYRTSIGARLQDVYGDPYKYEYKRIGGKSIDDIMKETKSKTEYQQSAKHQAAYQ